MSSGTLKISHKRPGCPTVKALKKVGYSGELRIVADDMDETPYGELYQGRVVRFNKKDYMRTTDTVDNFQKETTPVYARNASKYEAQSYGNIVCPSLFHFRKNQKRSISQDLPYIISGKWKKVRS